VAVTVGVAVCVGEPVNVGVIVGVAVKEGVMLGVIVWVGVGVGVTGDIPCSCRKAKGKTIID